MNLVKSAIVSYAVGLSGVRTNWRCYKYVSILVHTECLNYSYIKISWNTQTFRFSFKNNLVYNKVVDQYIFFYIC